MHPKFTRINIEITAEDGNPRFVLSITRRDEDSEHRPVKVINGLSVLHEQLRGLIDDALDGLPHNVTAGS